jgi:hypothetical protein
MSPSELRTETLRRFTAWRLKPNEHLPLVESLADLKPKSSSQVAARATAAGYLAAFCFGVPAEKVRKDLERFALWQHLSAEEQALMTNPDARINPRRSMAGLSKPFSSWHGV